MIEWEIHGKEIGNCNCAFGCPCEFNALPTYGGCEAALAYEIHSGNYGDVSLHGLRSALVVIWPGAIHEGDGRMQIIIDESASAEQRAALQSIMTGGDTDDVATMWWVFSAMCPTKLVTLYKAIELEIDVDNRVGRAVVPGIFELVAEPIRNPVTGAAHRIRIDQPYGFEYEIAEIGSGTTKTSGELDLPNNNNTHAQFAELHLSNKGVIRNAV